MPLRRGSCRNAVLLAPNHGVTFLNRGYARRNQLPPSWRLPHKSQPMRPGKAMLEQVLQRGGMMNWTMITLRASALPVLLALAGFALAWILSKLSISVPGADRYGSLAIGVSLLLAAAIYGVFIYRLFRWERGAWRECRTCGGPLGWWQPGKRYFGKQLDDYRRCYNCGKATSEAP